MPDTFEVAVSVSEIGDPDPEPAEPTTPDDTEVHVNVVPATAFGFVMKTLVAVPEQIVWFDAAASGVGSTVTVTVNVDPTQDPAAPEVGVTV